jgi:hypothetical protein
MKKLTIQDWSLIARYLGEGATPIDMLKINSLIDHSPELKEELLNMSLNFSGPKDQTKDGTDHFDAGQAFQKLHERIQREKLI